MCLYLNGANVAMPNHRNTMLHRSLRAASYNCYPNIRLLISSQRYSAHHLPPSSNFLHNRLTAMFSMVFSKPTSLPPTSCASISRASVLQLWYVLCSQLGQRVKLPRLIRSIRNQRISEKGTYTSVICCGGDRSS